MRAFKYTEERYAESAKAGQLKLSLLSYFRDFEGKIAGSKIPDPMEGCASTHIQFRKELVLHGKDGDLAALEGFGIRGFENADRLENSKINLVNVQCSPECYILSLSSSADNDSLSAEGKLAVLKVRYLHIVADTLRRTHPDKLGAFKIGRVSYEPRGYDFREGRKDGDPFKKNPVFADQQEIRIAWLALSDEPSFITACPAITEHIERLAKDS